MRAAYRRRKNRTFFSMLLVTLVFTICLSLSSVVFAGEDKKEQTYKYYTSVQIESGDSLWSIANKYCTEGNMDISDYIKEIKQINHLTTDNITSGQYLTVIYFSTEYK